MSLKIDDPKWSYAVHSPVSGAQTQKKGGLLAAYFTCTCGHVWRATTSKERMAEGYFVETQSSLKIRCSACQQEWSVPRQEYVNL